MGTRWVVVRLLLVSALGCARGEEKPVSSVFLGPPVTVDIAGTGVGWRGHGERWVLEMEGLRASVDEGGLTVQPGEGVEPANAVRFASSELKRGGWRAKATAWNGAGAMVARGFSGGREELLVGEDALEQRWHFVEPPAGSGPLVVRVDVRAALTARAESGLHFAAGGRGLRYGHGTWVDARGAATPIPATWEAGAISLTVPESLLNTTVWPAVLDPIITGELLVDAGRPRIGRVVHQFAPRVVSTGVGQTTVVWRADGGPSSIMLGRVSPPTEVAGVSLIVSAQGAQDALPTAAAASGGVVVTFESFDGGVQVAQVSADGGIGRLQTLGAGSTPNVSTLGPGHLVVWRTGSRLVGTRLSGQGLPIEPVPFTITNTADSMAELSFDGTNAFVAWSDTRSGSATGWGARVSTSGAVLDPTGIRLTDDPVLEPPSLSCVENDCMVVWLQTGDAGLAEVRGTRVAGTRVFHPEGRLLSDAPAAASGARVAHVDGGVWVVWADQRGLRRRTTDSSGLAATPSVLVVEPVGVSEWSVAGGPTPFIAWRQFSGHRTSSIGGRFPLVAASGPPFQVSRRTGLTSVAGIDMVSTADGYIAAWNSGNLDDFMTEVQVARMDSALRLQAPGPVAVTALDVFAQFTGAPGVALKSDGRSTLLGFTDSAIRNWYIWLAADGGISDAFQVSRRDRLQPPSMYTQAGRFFIVANSHPEYPTRTVELGPEERAGDAGPVFALDRLLLEDRLETSAYEETLWATWPDSNFQERFVGLLVDGGLQTLAAVPYSGGFVYGDIAAGPGHALVQSLTSSWLVFLDGGVRSIAVTIGSDKVEWTGRRYALVAHNVIRLFDPEDGGIEQLDAGARAISCKPSLGQCALAQVLFSASRVSFRLLAETQQPIATGLRVTTSEDQSVAITLSGTDPEGAPLTYVLESPANGRLAGMGPVVTYAPGPNFFGRDAFRYRVFDGAALSEPATVVIDVAPVNDAPIATERQVTVMAGLSVPVMLQATDVDGDLLTYRVVTAPVHGSVSGAPPLLTYGASASFAGADSLRFVANDGTVDSNVAEVRLTVLPGATGGGTAGGAFVGGGGASGGSAGGGSATAGGRAGGGVGAGGGSAGGSVTGGGSPAGGGVVAGGGSSVAGGSATAGGGGVAVGGGSSVAGGSAPGGGSPVGGGIVAGGGSVAAGGGATGGGSSTSGGGATGGGFVTGGGVMTGGGAQVGGGSSMGGGSATGGGTHAAGGVTSGGGSATAGGTPMSGGSAGPAPGPAGCGCSHEPSVAWLGFGVLAQLLARRRKR